MLVWLLMVVSAPVSAGLILIGLVLWVVSSWGLVLSAYLVALVLVSGVLVLLLYLTSLIANLRVSSSLIWYLVVFISSISWEFWSDLHEWDVELVTVSISSLMVLLVILSLGLSVLSILIGQGSALRA